MDNLHVLTWLTSALSAADPIHSGRVLNLWRNSPGLLSFTFSDLLVGFNIRMFGKITTYSLELRHDTCFIYKLSTAPTHTCTCACSSDSAKLLLMSIVGLT